ncbi:MAG: response regulator [Phycisphaerales bacterium JB039]
MKPARHTGKIRGHAAGPEGRPNTLGLASRDLEAVLNQIDRAGRVEAPRRRAFVRWEFRRPSVRIDLLQPQGGVISVTVATRNLSAGGLSVLHSAYAHQGSEVLVHMPRLSGSTTLLRGAVRMCRHVQGVVHEIGIEFDAQIDVREFIEIDELGDRFSLEHVDGEKLVGRVLCVTASEMDQKVIRHYLRETQLTMRCAATGEEGLAQTTDRFDLIIADLDLPDMSGAEFVSRLFASGSSSPVIMLAPDSSRATRQRLRTAAAGAYLPKPIDQESLLRAIAEFCLVKGGAGPLISALREGSPNAQLVPDFIAYLKAAVEKLRATIDANDHELCRTISLQIAGVAPTVGFGPIADAAQMSALAVSASMNVREAEASVRALIDVCERAQPALSS